MSPIRTGPAMAAFLGVLLATAVLVPAVQAKPVPLRYWIWDNTQLPAVKTMVAKFAQTHPDIDVKVELVANDSYWTKLLTVLAGGSAPDVFWIDMATFSVWSRRKMLLDLQPYIDADKEAGATVKAMWKMLSSFYSYNGHAYAMPRDYDTICAFYSEDALKTAGLLPLVDIEKSWTWDTLTEYGKKLIARQGDKVTRWGFFATGNDQSCWLNFVYSNGGDVFRWNADGTDEFVMDTPEAAKALQWLADKRWKEGISPDIQTYNANWPDNLWTSGKAAIITQGDWSMIGYNAAIKKFKWNVAELPLNPANNKRVSVIHGLADAVNSATKHKREAFEFVKFMGSKEAQAVLGNTGTVIPSRTDVEHLFFSTKLNPSNRRAFERAVEYSKPYPTSRYVIGQFFTQTIDNGWVRQIWDGKMSVARALEACKKDMAAMIKRYSR